MQLNFKKYKIYLIFNFLVHKYASKKLGSEFWCNLIDHIYKKILKNRKLRFV